jgi:hypothetical protein
MLHLPQYAHKSSENSVKPDGKDITTNMPLESQQVIAIQQLLIICTGVVVVMQFMYKKCTWGGLSNILLTPHRLIWEDTHSLSLSLSIYIICVYNIHI